MQNQKVINSMKQPLENGFSLIELIITLLILSIIMLAAIPSWSDVFKRKRLSAAVEEVADTLSLARSESTSRAKNITASFTINGETSWCMALSDSGDCNCLGGICTMEGGTRLIQSTSFKDTSISLIDFNGNNYVTFDSIRGVASNSGSIVFSNPPYSIKLIINKMGVVSTCSDNVTGYGSC